MALLVFPTATVRASYLDGERAAAQEEGADLAWLDRAAADFDRETDGGQPDGIADGDLRYWVPTGRTAR